MRGYPRCDTCGYDGEWTEDPMPHTDGRLETGEPALGFRNYPSVGGPVICGPCMLAEHLCQAGPLMGQPDPEPGDPCPQCAADGIVTLWDGENSEWLTTAEPPTVDVWVRQS